MPRPAKPWFRFYSEALESRKVQALPGPLFKHWLNLLCLTNISKTRGQFPPMEDIAFALRVKEEVAQKIIADLVERRFIDWVAGGLVAHDWPDWQRDRDVAPDKRDENRGNVTVSDGNRDVSVTREEERREDKDREEDSLEEDTEAEADKITRRLRDWRQPSTKGIKQEIAVALYERGFECIHHCMDEAERYNKTSWAYTASILRRHATQGCDPVPGMTRTERLASI